MTLVLGVLCAAGAASALTFTIQASDSGWYDNTGAHTASNQTYAAGYDGFGQLRNFFTFDLATLPDTQSVLSVTLRLYNPADGEPTSSFDGGYQSGDASETYEVHEVTTSAAVITLGGVGLTPIYTDLGDGPAYGSAVLTLASNGTFVEIALNASGIADVQGHLTAPDDYVIGGLMTTYSGQTSAEEAIFALTDPAGFGPFSRELVVVMTPEPGTGFLMALGMLTLGAARTRRARIGG